MLNILRYEKIFCEIDENFYMAKNIRGFLENLANFLNIIVNLNLSGDLKFECL